MTSTSSLDHRRHHPGHSFSSALANPNSSRTNHMLNTSPQGSIVTHLTGSHSIPNGGNTNISLSVRCHDPGEPAPRGEDTSERHQYDQNRRGSKFPPVLVIRYQTETPVDP